MIVFIHDQTSFKDLSIAGRSSFERMKESVAFLNAPILIGDRPTLIKSFPVEGPILWFEGLFPLLTSQALREFIEASRALGGYGFQSNDGIHGVCLLNQCSNPPRHFQDLLHVPPFKGETPKFPKLVAQLHPLVSTTDLSELNRLAFQEKARQLSAKGVVFVDRRHVWIEATVEVEAGAVLNPNVFLYGSTHIETGVVIHPGASLKNTVVERDAVIQAYSVLEDCHVGQSASVGPFAHIRPGSVLEAQTKVGNFVETKKTRLGKGSKASHLAYIGDARVGEDCNIGAGVITCNYDGYNKHQTVLGDRVFVGSDCQLIAPVSLKDGCFVAAGSTVTQDVPTDALAISRSKQINVLEKASRIREKALSKKASNHNVT